MADLRVHDGRSSRSRWPDPRVHDGPKFACGWFVEHGATLSFDRLLVLDWDVLLLGPVSYWTNSINERSVKFIDVWENKNPDTCHWTRSSSPQFVEFSAKFEERNRTGPPLYNAFLFAYALPRQALEDCAQTVREYPGYCEYRLPTILRSRGYDLGNLPRPDHWTRLANVNGRSISRKIIRAELARPDGYRLFHPVYEPYQSEGLELSPADWIAEGCLYRTVSRSVKDLVKRGVHAAQAWNTKVRRNP